MLNKYFNSLTLMTPVTFLKKQSVALLTVAFSIILVAKYIKSHHLAIKEIIFR